MLANTNNFGQRSVVIEWLAKCAEPDYLVNWAAVVDNSELHLLVDSVADFADLAVLRKKRLPRALNGIKYKINDAKASRKTRAAR